MNSLKLLLTFVIFDVFVSGHEVFEAVPSDVTGQRFMREPLDQVSTTLKTNLQLHSDMFGLFGLK